MNSIIVDQLVKVFHTENGTDKRAVDGISFSVPAGHIYGLLGPNGAGKTTTLRMISGLMSPSSGTATVAGYDVARESLQAKRSIGFLTANTSLYQRLTPRETLRYFAELHGMSRAAADLRAAELISWLHMDEFAEMRCGSLSTGQRQRANIGRALVANPPVLIMDEPTLGLDVLSNRIILEFIRRERQEGKSIVLSTHYLDEAEEMCDSVGLLHRGKLVACGTIDDLRQLAGTDRLSNIFLKLVGESKSIGATIG